MRRFLIRAAITGVCLIGGSVTAQDQSLSELFEAYWQGRLVDDLPVMAETVLHTCSRYSEITSSMADAYFRAQMPSDVLALVNAAAPDERNIHQMIAAQVLDWMALAPGSLAGVRAADDVHLTCYGAALRVMSGSAALAQ